jgi:uncharacterized protein
VAETALITGASAGIGEQFARQLAARGYDLILVARRKDRLEELAADLPTKTAVIECDLATEADSLASKVKRSELQVDLLVNNAGFGLRGHFTDLDPKREAEMVRVNCEAVVTLTHAFVPAMVERGRGGVTYAASKAFAISFMEALWMELRGTGVTLTVVNPGPVKTEWQEVAGYDEQTPIPPGMITAERCVQDALRAYDRKKRSVVTGRFFPWFMRAGKGPKGVKLRVAERMYRPKS